MNELRTKNRIVEQIIDEAIEKCPNTNLGFNESFIFISEDGKQATRVRDFSEDISDIMNRIGLKDANRILLCSYPLNSHIDMVCIILE